MSKKKVNKCKWGEKTYKTCFFALSLSFLYKVGKLEKLSLPLTSLNSLITSGNAKYLNVYTPFTQRRFYKAKNGEFPLNPQMQADLLEIFKERGADLSLGFASYEEQDVLVEK